MGIALVEPVVAIADSLLNGVWGQLPPPQEVLLSYGASALVTLLVGLPQLLLWGLVTLPLVWRVRRAADG